MANDDYFPLDPDFVVPEQIDEGVLRSRSMGRTDFQRITGPPLRLFRLMFNNRASSEKASLLQFYRELESSWFAFTHVAYLAAGSPIEELERTFPVRFHSAPTFELVGFECWNIEVELIEAVGCALLTDDYPDPDDGHPTMTIAGTISGSDEIFVYAGYGFIYTGTGTVTLDGAAVADEKLDVPLGLHRLYVTGGSGTLEALI